jgi:hypothetical protein
VCLANLLLPGWLYLQNSSRSSGKRVQSERCPKRVPWFYERGIGQGHLDRFYQTIEQRFLGDERFVDDVKKKTKETSRQRSRLNLPAWWRGWRRCMALKRGDYWHGAQAKLGKAAVAVGLCGAGVIRDQKRDKRSESELQRSLDKSIT